MSSKDIGLVLCGGGGKGAFQIGAWKALEEHGILEQVGAIAGTSVGGLNAVLFALGNYNKAIEVWSKVNMSLMLTPTDEMIEMLKTMKKKFAKGKHPSDAFKVLAGSKGIRNVKSIFSRDGLEKLIKDNLSVRDIKTVNTDVFVTIQEKNSHDGIQYVHLNSLKNEKNIINALFATSSIPIIYGATKFQGNLFHDGGITEFGNVPVKPLYDLGYRKIVILSLSSEFNMESVKTSRNEAIDLYHMYPECEFTVIKPSESLGGYEGMLDFRQKSIQEKVCMGYHDAENILSRDTGSKTLWQQCGDRVLN